MSEKFKLPALNYFEITSKKFDLSSFEIAKVQEYYLKNYKSLNVTFSLQIEDLLKILKDKEKEYDDYIAITWNWYLNLQILTLRAFIKMKENKTNNIYKLSSLYDNNAPQNISKQSYKIDELRKQEAIQRYREQIQAEIMSCFIQYPDENILNYISFSKNNWKNQDWSEEFFIASWILKNQNLDLIVNEKGIKIKWDKFAKSLVIDRHSDMKWMLIVWESWYSIDKIDFENIADYNEFPNKTYFVYMKNWTPYIKTLKK